MGTARIRPNRAGRGAAGDRRRRAGFSLAEILIAIGILSIGMGLVVTIFPAALGENNKSINDVLGSLIGNNGITVGKSVLTAGDVTSPALIVLADEATTGDLATASQHYPAGGDGKMGFVLLGRRLFADADTACQAYQLVAVAYRKAGASNSVTAQSVSGTVAVNGDVVEFTASANSGNLRAGSPLIHKATGLYARIKGVNGTQAVLNRQPGSGAVSGDWFVIVEAGPPDVPSPAMAVLVTRTGLQP